MSEKAKPVAKMIPKGAQYAFVTVLWAYALGMIWVAAHTRMAPENPKTKEGEALRHIEQALQARPDDPDYLTNMGLALQQGGRSHEAIPYLHQALALTPDNWRAYDLLGFALIDEGDYAGAVTNFEHASRLNPRNGIAAEGIAKATWLAPTPAVACSSGWGWT